MKYSNTYNIASNVSVEFTRLVLEDVLLRDETKAKSRNPVDNKLNASLGYIVPCCYTANKSRTTNQKRLETIQSTIQ